MRSAHPVLQCREYAAKRRLYIGLVIAEDQGVEIDLDRAREVEAELREMLAVGYAKLEHFGAQHPHPLRAGSGAGG